MSTAWEGVTQRQTQKVSETDRQTDRQTGRHSKHLVGQHALLLTDGSNHLIHFVRHFLEEPVSVLDTRCADGLTLHHIPDHEHIKTPANIQQHIGQTMVDTHGSKQSLRLLTIQGHARQTVVYWHIL